MRSIYNNRVKNNSFLLRKASVDRRLVNRLEALARSYEPALRDAFLAAIRSARQRATLETIEQALTQIDPAQAIRSATGGLEFSQMQNTLADIVEAAGSQVTESLRPQLPTQIREIARFDIVNPYAADYARREVGRLIRNITQTTMEGVQTLINRGITEGITVRDTARQIRTMVGLTDQQMRWVMNYELRLLDRGEINIEAKVQRYADKVLRYRANTIARNETLSASAAGQQSAWQAAIDQGFLTGDETKVWIVAKDARLCEEICEPMGGQKRKLRDPFKTGDGRLIQRPPAHVQCRCSTGLVL